MKVSQEQLRLKEIKLKRVFWVTKCESCGNLFKKEKMWHVKRWGINRTHWSFYYCQNCMHSAEEVLNEIDTDANVFGIYPVDAQTINKKSYERYNKALEILP
jgi:hypothetical protein